MVRPVTLKKMPREQLSMKLAEPKDWKRMKKDYKKVPGDILWPAFGGL